MTSDLTFSDWDNYTDADSNARTLDWTSAAALQGQLAYPYLDALRQALNERQALFASPIPALPAGSPFARHWAWHVVGSVAGLVVGSTYGSGLWVDPALLSTLHNVEHYASAGSYGDDIVAAAYTGLNAGYMPGGSETAWLASLNRLMDDAGVTDTVFRAWAEDWNHHANRYYAPSAALLWNLKQMLAHLDTLIVLEMPRPADSATSQPWGSSGLKVTGGTSAGRAVHYEDATTWADAVTAFNATSWAGTWPAEGPYWSTVGHKAQDGTGGITINRVRRTDSFIIPTIPSAAVEIAGNLYAGYGSELTPADFTGLSGYAYDQQYLLEVRDTLTTTGGTRNTPFGDFGDCSLDAETLDWIGWILGNYSLRFDFAGSLLFQ